MSDMSLKICHLYPEVLNLYGDRGNIQCLRNRLLWRGIDCEVAEAKIGSKESFADYDLFFIGGGQDFEQEVLLQDLKSGRGDEIKRAIEDGKTFLAICGGYQMLGHYYETKDHVKCEFLGAIDFYTVGADVRMIGNYAYRHTTKDGRAIDIVGFENHSGRTYLGEGVAPLGAVLSGYGNNGEDKTEGVHYRNVYGTYSHGPVLPKNPELTDLLLSTALSHKYGRDVELSALEDNFERAAHDEVLAKVLSGTMSQD